MARIRFENEIDALGIFSGREVPAVVSQAEIVRICLIDPGGVFKGKQSLRNEFMTKLKDKFNDLDAQWLKNAGLKFDVLYLSKEPANAANFKKLDFPVYLLAEQYGSKTVLDLMKRHKIPQKIGQTDIYDYARDSWQQKDVRGVGIPSDTGFRKVGFIKTKRVFDDAPGDFAQAFVNVTSHEIGHMGNRKNHSKKGLMKYPVPLAGDIDFDRADKYLFLSDLMRLKRL